MGKAGSVLGSSLNQEITEGVYHSCKKDLTNVSTPVLALHPSRNAYANPRTRLGT